MVGAEAGILVQQMGERLHHERRADEKNESEGYFHDDEGTAKSRSAGNASGGSFFQSIAWSHARGTARRCETENNT